METKISDLAPYGHVYEENFMAAHGDVPSREGKAAEAPFEDVRVVSCNFGVASKEVP